MAKEVRERTLWSFVNFNNTGPDLKDAKGFIAVEFLRSFADQNQIDIYSLEQVERILTTELNRFERGPAKLLVSADPAEYARRRTDLIQGIMDDPQRFSEAIARHYSGERRLGLVVVFDNVDKRSRDQQLRIFEAA
jgi:hypothetical protein